MSAPLTNRERGPESAVARTIGLHGRTAVYWTMAGGIALGGVLVAAMTLAGRLSGHAIFLETEHVIASRCPDLLDHDLRQSTTKLLEQHYAIRARKLQLGSPAHNVLHK